MSRKTIRKSGPELIKESAISFQKQKNGLFKKVETFTMKDMYTSLVTKVETKECDELYRQTLDDDFDHELVFENIDGTKGSIRLKVVDPDDWKK